MCRGLVLSIQAMTEGSKDSVPMFYHIFDHVCFVDSQSLFGATPQPLLYVSLLAIDIILPRLTSIPAGFILEQMKGGPNCYAR